MPELPKRKIGIVACSGEEAAEGTVTRMAALKVLESLRPRQTVTICLPLFLAGGEGDRAFARFYPTIAVDGCEKRCAARGTEMYSGKPAVSVVVSDRAPASSSGLGSARRLSETGMQVVDDVAQRIAEHVDQLLNVPWDRRSGLPLHDSAIREGAKPQTAPCSCSSGIPVNVVGVAGRQIPLIALPLIFTQFREAGKLPNDSTKSELMQAMKIYNSIPHDEEAACGEAVLREYAAFYQESH